MTSKVLAIISDDDKLHRLCSQMEEREKFLDRKLKDLKQKADDAVQQFKDDTKPQWDEVKAHLEEKGRLESYNDQTHHLCFNMKRDCIELHENNSNPFGHFLSQIFIPPS